jgi:hypothetical protein
MSDELITPQEALEALMRKLGLRNAELAARVQSVVDEGKDIEETEPSGGKRTRDARVYRKIVPYSYEEALKVAIDALSAYFVEEPHFVNSFLDNFSHAALGDSEEQSKRAVGIIPNTLDTEKLVQIELRTETQISQLDQETQLLTRVSAQQIQEQQSNIARLRELVGVKAK